MANNRKTGSYYEEQAAVYLESLGMTVLEHNYRNKRGEIDLIAKESSTIVFIEVKYRSSTSCGTPGEAVTAGKQRTISWCALAYMMEHHLPEDNAYRFDVISIGSDALKHYRNAFDFCG